jgi:AcrR family transcriptional regulator
MSKKQRLFEFNRNNILSAAKKLFSEKGIIQTTMDEIAKKADCSKSTVYVYFKSKEEIFDYIVLEYFTLLRNGIEDALDNAKEFPDGYFSICNTIAKFYDNYPAYFDSILGEIKIAEDESNAILFRIYTVGEQINNIIESHIKSCISDGNIRNDLTSLSQVTFALWGGICGIISLAYKKEKYIWHKMQVSKEVFMQNGFTLLLQSILPQGNT